MTESGSSNLNNGDAAGLKKPAWNKPFPLNGVVESGSVMGGDVFWPALSELTKPTTKSSAVVSKLSSEGSTFASQVPLMSETLQRPINSSPNVNSTTNHGLPRQRSMRHHGSGGGSSNGTSGGPVPFSYNRSPPPPPLLPPSFPAMGLLPPYGTFVAPILDNPPVRGGRPMGGLRPQSGSDQSMQPQRSASRRNEFGPRPRGDGQHNHNNRGRRDSHCVVPPFTPGPYIPPPSPGSASFIAPPNMRPFMTPMGYDITSPYIMVPSLGPESFRGMPFIPQAPAPLMFYPPVDMQLRRRILNQIEFYFSDINLEQDNYLKSKMDEEGWVSIDLIANFPRVHQMTTDVRLILESLRNSVSVEVQGNKIRKRYTWSLWVRRGTRVSADSGSQPPNVVLPSNDRLSASIQQMTLNVENSDITRSEDTFGPR